MVESGLPFEGMSTGQRVHHLRGEQQRIRALESDNDERQLHRLIRDAYRQLRDAWERAVEEVLFAGVVLRYDDGVKTKQLRVVSVEDSDYETVEREMTKCSSHCHDRAELADVEPPSPDELLEDIEVLDSWRVQLEKRRDETRKRRRSG